MLKKQSWTSDKGRSEILSVGYRAPAIPHHKKNGDEILHKASEFPHSREHSAYDRQDNVGVKTKFSVAQ
jgi:hypothetical protein